MFASDIPASAEAIFFEGPETVIAAAQLIVAGPPQDIVKRVEKRSAGTAPIAMEWTISGIIMDPIVLKGAAAPPRVTFQRHEQSLFAMLDKALPDWELELGSAEQAGAAVLFYRAPYPADPVKVLPSPPGGVDLVGLVADIVRIQSLPEAQRFQAWSDYALMAPAAEGRRAALRRLVLSDKPWPSLAYTWLHVLNHGPREVRSFAYRLMLFALSRGRWSDSRADILSLARDTFRIETNPGLALEFADGLMLLHGAAARDPARLTDVRVAVCDILRQRETLGPSTDEHTRSINEAYRQQRDECLSAPR